MAPDYDLDESSLKFLSQVRKVAGEKPGGSAPMWEIGQAMGLDRGRTEDLAMGLVGEGLLEIKSLSGALSLTQAGLELAGDGPEPESDQAADAAGVLEMIRKAVDQLGLTPDAANDLGADVKALQAQLQRSRPLPEVERGLWRAVLETLGASSRPEAEGLKTAVKSLPESS